MPGDTPVTTKHPYAEAFDLPGGPAFPISIPGAGDNGAHGMSLRDWFAGQVLLGLVTSGQEMGRSGQPASLAYRLADEMLERRCMKP